MRFQEAVLEWLLGGAVLLAAPFTVVSDLLIH